MKYSIWIFALTLLTLASPAYANDAVFGGAGSDLIPLKEKRIKMVSEDIEIVETAKSKAWDGRHWSIKATYIFENPTEESITTTFGFPESTCDEDGDCNSRDDSKFTFHDMKTSVDGKRVKMTTGSVKKDSEWSKELERVHLFEVTIPAGKKVEVVHRYLMGTSGSSMQDEWVTYVTRTGALWNGPIGSAKFTIKLLERPWGFSFPADYKLESFGTSKDGKTTTIAFAMKDWTPKQDLNVLLGSDFTSTAGCPSLITDGWDFYGGEEDTKPDLKAVAKAFEGKKLEDVRRCRNLVYAAHGYTFKDRSLQDFFYAYQTPVDEKKTEKFWGYSGMNYMEGPSKAVVFAPDPNYKPSHLNKRERRWVKALKAYEKSLKKK